MYQKVVQVTLVRVYNNNLEKSKQSEKIPIPFKLKPEEQVVVIYVKRGDFRQKEQ